MSEYEFAQPDPDVVQMLTEDIHARWLSLVQHSPEAELDAMLLSCDVLRGRREPAIAIDQRVLHVESSDIGGEEAGGSIWGQIRSCPTDFTVQIYGCIAGINSLMLVRGGLRGGVFDMECVHKAAPIHADADEEAFFDRIQRWCIAVVRLGAALGAANVEVPGRYDATPIVLWRRSETDESG